MLTAAFHNGGMKKLVTAFLGFAVLALMGAMAVPTPPYDPAAVARLHAGIADCVGCNLKNADLANTCVTARDLRGADFDGADATMMCMALANFAGASFRNANLSGAKLDGADLTGAETSITSFLGTDLRHTKGLTQAQLDIACSDSRTQLPAGLRIHTCE